MANEKIYVADSEILYATYIGASVYDNTKEFIISSVDFDKYVDVKIEDDDYWLTIHLDYGDVDEWRYHDLLSKTERIKLMTEEGYSKLRKALRIFDNVIFEFYIDTEVMDEEFAINFIL